MGLKEGRVGGITIDLFKRRLVLDKKSSTGPTLTVEAVLIQAPVEVEDGLTF